MRPGPRLLSLALVLVGACGAPTDDGTDDTDASDTEPSDTEGTPTAAWASLSPLAVDLAQPFLDLGFVAAGCDAPEVVLTVAEGGEQRVVALPGVAEGDAVTVSVAVDGLLPEGTACVLDRALSLTAEVRCGGMARPVDGARSLTVQVGAAAVDGLSGAARLFRRRPISNAYDDTLWAIDGRAVIATSLPGAAVGRRVEIPGVEAGGPSLIRVRGDHHDFLAVRCTLRCPELALPGVAALAPGGAPTVPATWILAVPVDVADGTLDAVARVAVPAGVVDLAFHDGTLSVLSQLGDHALLATFREKEQLPTSAPLDAQLAFLPQPVGVAFQPAGDGSPLVALRTSTDPAAAETVFFDPVQEETIPVPTPTGGGGCGSPGGTVLISPSTGGSSSIPASNGNEAGTATGTVSGTTGSSGCIKSFSMDVKVGALRASGLDAVGTVAVDDWTVDVGVPAALVGGPVVDGVGVRDHLVVAVGDGAGRAGLLWVDLVARTARWLTVPGASPDLPERLVALRHLQVAADGLGVIVGTDTGFHVFDGDGTWVAGTEGLSQACLALEPPDVVSPVDGQLAVTLRTGLQAFALPAPGR